MHSGRFRRLAAGVVLCVLAIAILTIWLFKAFDHRERLSSSKDDTQAAEIAGMLARAERAMEAGAFGTARKRIQDVLRRDPENSRALLYQAAFFEEDGELMKAQELLARISDSPASFGSTARYMEGKISLHQNRARTAEAQFARSLQLNPGYVPPAAELIQLFALQLRGDDLAAVLLRLRKVQPLSVPQLAMNLLAGREIVDHSQAVPILRAFVTEDPSDVKSILALARYRVLVGDVAGALSFLKMHEGVIQEDDESRAFGALLRIRSGELAAEETFPVRQPLDESSPLDAWFLAAELASRAGNWKSSVEIHRYLLSRQPYSTAVSHSLATALDRMGRTSEAAVQHGITGRLDQLEVLAYRMVRPQAVIPEMAVPVMCEISDILKELNQAEEALEWLAAAQTLNARHSGIVSRLSELQSNSAGIRPELVRPPPNSGQLTLPVAGGDSVAPSPHSEADWVFRDVAAELGIDFVYHNGQSPRKRILETIGGGSAALDIDGDLWPDLYLPQGQFAAASGAAEQLIDRLFRNVRGKAFVDCTEAAGILDREHSLSATVADFDNDGFADVFVANAGPCRLFKNCGDGTFAEVTPSAISMRHDCSSCACFADLNEDGLLDLFVVSYVADWEKTCVNSEGQFATCDPREFEPGQSRIYQNVGDGSFIDVTDSSGLGGITGRGLGVIAADLTSDGRIDIFVANDGLPNFLFRNVSTNQEIRLEEIAAQAGVAVDENGRSQAGMGVAAADFDHNGFLDVFVTNFYREQNTLYAGLGSGLFTDDSRRSGLGPPSFQLLGFGTQAIDINSDGHEDLFVVNGDIDDYSSFGRPWKMPAQVFRNKGNGQFEDVSERCGDDVRIPQLGRGLTRVDFDGDLVNDIVVVRHDGAMKLLRNETPGELPVIAIKVVSGVGSNDAFGAGISSRIGAKTSSMWLVSGDGFAASNQRILQCAVDSSNPRIVVTLPSGNEASEFPVQLNRRMTCIERTAGGVEIWYLPH